MYNNPNEEIPTQQRGRPLILGDIDAKVVRFLTALRDRGGHVSYQIAITVATVLMERSSHPHIRSQRPPRVTSARSLNWNQRARTTSKVSIPTGAQKEAELLFLNDIVAMIETHTIPHELVLNLDQTPSKYINTSRFTMAPKGTKKMAKAGSEDKRAITATFTVTLAGDFLGMQLIYGGKLRKVSLKSYSHTIFRLRIQNIIQTKKNH